MGLDGRDRQTDTRTQQSVMAPTFSSFTARLVRTREHSALPCGACSAQRRLGTQDQERALAETLQHQMFFSGGLRRTRAAVIKTGSSSLHTGKKNEGCVQG